MDGADFERLSRLIGSNIQKISQNVSSIQRMVNQLGTHQDTEDLRKKLHQIQHYTHQLAIDTNQHLKDLRALPLPMNPSDQRQRKLQKERLTDEFSHTLNKFQETQRMAASREKESVKRAKQQNTFALEDDARARHLIELESPVESKSVQLQMEDQVSIEGLQERERAIQQIEADIVDVNQIFKDLATMVHQQGEVIDSIEANVENTNVSVTEGTEQLSKARNYQAKARKKTCILIAIAAGILILVVFFIVYESKN